MKFDLRVVWAAKLLYPSPLKGPATRPKEIREISSHPLDIRSRTPYNPLMTTTPADNPCNCRACGTIIFPSVTDMCEDCEADMNRYYDDREEPFDGRVGVGEDAGDCRASDADWDDRGDAQAEAMSEEYEYTDAEAAEAEARADANADAPYYEEDEGYLDYGDGPDW